MAWIQKQHIHRAEAMGPQARALSAILCYLQKGPQTAECVQFGMPNLVASGQNVAP